MLKITLTEKEQNEVKTLIRLGDTEEIARQTVIAARIKNDTSDFYRNAYEL
jgi:hypothetical protein